MNKHQQVIYGLHVVLALLERNAERIYRICINPARHDKKIAVIQTKAQENGIQIERVSLEQLNQMTNFAKHQGVIAFCKKKQTYSENDLKDLLEELSTPAFLLILDGVQDPHNLGACFRAADAAGVHAIIAPKDKSVGITSIVSKVASGATENIPFIQVTNLVRTLNELKKLGIWIYGATEAGSQSIYTTNFSGPVAIVMGAEGSGLRRLTKEICDMLISIPMQGSVSSLNVSVATGIFLFEVLRQRLQG